MKLCIPLCGWSNREIYEAAIKRADGIVEYYVPTREETPESFSLVLPEEDFLEAWQIMGLDTNPEYWLKRLDQYETDLGNVKSKRERKEFEERVAPLEKPKRALRLGLNGLE